MVPQHILDLQMPDRDDLILVHQLGRELLQGVPTHVSDMLVDAGDADALLLMVLRARHCSRKAALGSCQLLLILGEILRIPGFRAIAHSAERLEPDVDVDASLSAGSEGCFFLDAEGNEVFPRCCLGYGRIQDAPIKVTALADADETDLRELQMAPDKADAIFLVPRAIALLLSVLRVEARIPSPLLEEVLKDSIQVPQSLLQGHGIRFLQSRRLLAPLHFRHEATRVLVGDRVVVRLPLIHPFFLDCIMNRGTMETKKCGSLMRIALALSYLISL